MSSRALVASLVAVVFSGGNVSLQAQCEAQAPQKLTAGDGATLHLFGYSVDLDQDRMLAGAWKKGDDGPYSGAVYAFERTGSQWGETQKIRASDAAQEDQFGYSLAMHGSWAVIGARFDDDGANNAGSAYVFEYDGSQWVERQILRAPDSAADDEFGSSVAFAEDVIVVGSPFDDDGGDKSGSCYVFERNGARLFQFTQKLLAQDAAQNDQFGSAVDTDGLSVVVGASLNNDDGFDSGSVYLFSKNFGSWEQQVELHADDASTGDQFGAAVALQGERLIVGAPREDEGGTDCGAAYVFDREAQGWVQSAKLLPDESSPNGEFGSSVALSGDRVMVGAPLDDETGTDAGAAYSFERGTGNWFQIDHFLSETGQSADQFGFSVAVDGSYGVVGVFLDDERGRDAGAAFVYSLDEFRLNVDPRFPVVGQTPLTLSTVGGIPGAPMLLAIVNIQGVESFFQVVVDTFDTTCGWDASLVPGVGLGGWFLTLQAYSVDGSGTLQATNREMLFFIE